MKILHLHSLFYPNVRGGAERSLQLLVEAQLSRGHVPIVVSLSPDGKTHTADCAGIKVYYLGLRNFYWPFDAGTHHRLAKPFWHGLDAYNPLMARAVGDVLDHETPDIVQTHNLTGFSAAVWPQVQHRNLPLIHTLHDYSLLCPKATMFVDGQNCVSQHWSCKFLSRPRTRLSQTLDALVSVSAFTLNRHLQAGLFTNVKRKEIIHNSRPTGVHQRSSSFQEHKPSFAFGFLGQLIPVKGIELLLSVVSQMPQSRPEVIIAGMGPTEYERYLKQKFEAPNIRFLGFTDPAAFFAQIDVLVVPSLWHEPLAGVIVEAYTYGLPVIGTIRGGIPELVDEMKTGLLFNPDNPAELAACLNKFLNDQALATSFRPACYEKAKMFSSEQMCERYDSVYEDIARR